jgi:hypothetical protein
MIRREARGVQICNPSSLGSASSIAKQRQGTFTLLRDISMNPDIVSLFDQGHAVKRPRGQGGRFLTVAEIAALDQQNNSQISNGKSSSTKATKVEMGQERPMKELRALPAHHKALNASLHQD